MVSVMLILKCLTNLHAGSGEVNYNIIDNEVERDPVSNYPTIHASGVKGALRAFFEENGNKNVKKWFGANSKEEKQPGFLKVLNASMLAIPMRTTGGSGSKPYQLVYTEEMGKQYEEIAEAFGIPVRLGKEENANVQVEGYQLKKMRKLQVGGQSYELYCMNEEDFKTRALPVIARNQLDNGISKNLWYEEVVPHKSMFYFPVIANDREKGLLEEFKHAVEGKVIQFGGNASIGYGLCKVFVEEGKHEQDKGK